MPIVVKYVDTNFILTCSSKALYEDYGMYIINKLGLFGTCNVLVADYQYSTATLSYKSL